ncbi:SRPBCC domain-containing protein [Leifsonia sp. TF02-11]|uniref:SRPBCC family protein n=1 Tax=Leifsonia sp. TF02-11 TaxID=2815212 RepID=UPI001AA0E369|nr:SRPBCC domain-containing protein [Leifsonia sp. TF02-11]MBO1740196.1 SRPBCC domain-containing protein [Leifsonia sp. TF02-11]
MKTIERTVSAEPETIWNLWTTPEGIAQWWAPDGFRTEVDSLDLRPGGELVYTMTAEAPEQVAFLEQNGLPLSTRSRKIFTELAPTSRIAYRSTIDFVPDHEPYEQLTVVDLQPAAEGTRVVMQVEELHDEVWTERLLAGRANELENLARLVG